MSIKDNSHDRIIDELSLLEIVLFFRKNWKKIVLGGILGGIFGSVYSLFIPNKYEGNATIEVTKVANINVEDPNVLIEKLKMPTYFSLNTFNDCKVGNLADPGAVLSKELNPSLIKNTSLISIKYRANSPEDIKKCLNNILVDIRNNQELLTRSILINKKNKLNTLKQKLNSVNEIIKRTPSEKLNFNFEDSKFSASTLLTAIILNKDNEAKDLKMEISDLEIALEEPFTKLANFAVPIHSTNIRVYPNRTIIALKGGIVGSLLIIVFLLARMSLLNIRKK